MDEVHHFGAGLRDEALEMMVARARLGLTATPPRDRVVVATLIFPDFRLQHRANPARRWLLEIVGFWTAEYVIRKLARYRSAQLSNLILCIDEERTCANTDLPANARVVRFRRRVDPAAVLAIISG